MGLSTSIALQHSTLQFIIAWALDSVEYGMVASSAIDLANVDLLPKHLKMIRIPNDVSHSIAVWLKEGFWYVSIDGVNSLLIDFLLGKIHG